MSFLSSKKLKIGKLIKLYVELDKGKSLKMKQKLLLELRFSMVKKIFIFLLIFL